LKATAFVDFPNSKFPFPTFFGLLVAAKGTVLQSFSVLIDDVLFFELILHLVRETSIKGPVV